jgi:hypothetical protein
MPGSDADLDWLGLPTPRSRRDLRTSAATVAESRRNFRRVCGDDLESPRNLPGALADGVVARRQSGWSSAPGAECCSDLPVADTDSANAAADSHSAMLLLAQQSNQMTYGK